MSKSTKYLKIICNLVLAIVTVLLIIFVVPRVLIYFMPFVVGFILSLIANPIVRFLDKRIKIKRKYGSFIIVVAVIGLVVFICYGIIAALIYGLSDFIAYLPTMTENAGIEISSAIYQFQRMINEVPFLKEVDLMEVSDSLVEYINNFLIGEEGSETVSALGDMAKSIPNMLVNFIMGLLATYFFIADRERLNEYIYRHIPKSFRMHMNDMYKQTLGVVGGYFKAQFKIMGVIYVIITVGLMILNINYAWLIGFGIAFLDMLPVFGTGTVLCPWAVIKLFSGDYKMAIGMLILYAVALVVHQLVQPKLIGESVGLEPFAALFFMYIGYKISSVVGMIIAIPIGMLLINLYKAGAFDNLKWCVKEICKDFNEFRKVGKDEDK